MTLQWVHSHHHLQGASDQASTWSLLDTWHYGLVHSESWRTVWIQIVCVQEKSTPHGSLPRLCVYSWVQTCVWLVTKQGCNDGQYSTVSALHIRCWWLQWPVLILTSTSCQFEACRSKCKPSPCHLRMRSETEGHNNTLSGAWILRIPVSRNSQYTQLTSHMGGVVTPEWHTKHITNTFTDTTTIKRFTNHIHHTTYITVPYSLIPYIPPTSHLYSKWVCQAPLSSMTCFPLASNTPPTQSHQASTEEQSKWVGASHMLNSSSCSAQ